MGQFDFNPALEPGVGFYVDDVYFATLTGSILDLLDLDRVEILRGPQGTLSGRNSIGGAVKLLFAAPPWRQHRQHLGGVRQPQPHRSAWQFRRQSGAGSGRQDCRRRQEAGEDTSIASISDACIPPEGLRPSRGHFSIAGAPDTLLVNPAGGVPATTSRSDCLLAKEGEVSYIATRGQLRWQPSDTIDINIVGDYTDDDRTAAGSVLLLRSYPNGAVASPGIRSP